MKLKNKKTGEIGRMVCTDMPLTTVHTSDGGIYSYRTLTELNEEWEDYEEPKEWWSIDQFGEPINVSKLNALQLEKLRRIGNLFQTEEEAEKAVEKLRAWQRLKDKGFKFCGHDDRDRGQLGDIVIYAEMPTFEYDDDLTRDDLDLLFGGEE